MITEVRADAIRNAAQAFARILLIVDPSMHRTPAFDRAAQLARSTGAELHLYLFDYLGAVNAVGIVSPQVMKLAQRAYLAEREEWLADLALELREMGIRTQTAVVWGAEIAEHVAAAVLERKPDLVLKDQHPEGALKRALLTPLDWQLLRLCPAPLLLVHPLHAAAPKRILAAVDPLHEAGAGAELDDRILEAARALAAQSGAELHLGHALGGLPPLLAEGPAAAQALNDAYDRLRLLHRSRFEALAQHHRVAADRAHLVYGLPHDAISHLAQEIGADTVVLGTIRRSGLQRILLGSTAERMLPLLACDVLAVKPAGFAAQLARELHAPAEIHEIA